MIHTQPTTPTLRPCPTCGLLRSWYHPCACRARSPAPPERDLPGVAFCVLYGLALVGAGWLLVQGIRWLGVLGGTP